MSETVIREISSLELDDFLSANPDAVLFDVRSREEWNEGHMPQAIHLDVRQLPARVSEVPNEPGKTVVCICAMGGRSGAACEYLAERGYRDLVNVAGGMLAYPGETVS